MGEVLSQNLRGRGWVSLGSIGGWFNTTPQVKEALAMIKEKHKQVGNFCLFIGMYNSFWLHRVREFRTLILHKLRLHKATDNMNLLPQNMGLCKALYAECRALNAQHISLWNIVLTGSHAQVVLLTIFWSTIFVQVAVVVCACVTVHRANTNTHAHTPSFSPTLQSLTLTLHSQ